MIVREFFDVIVVGTSLAPLTAGALLARRGLRVLVVGNGELEHESSSILFSTLGSDFVMRIFEELGVTHMVKRKMRRPDPLFQVILPDARLDMNSRREVFESETSREFPRIAEDLKFLGSVLPESMEGMEKIIRSGFLLPPEGLIEKKKIELLLSKTPFGEGKGRTETMGRVLSDPRFSCFLKAVAASHSFLDQVDIDPALCLFLHKRKVESCAVFEGGPKALKQVLFDRISAYGGEVRSDDLIEEVSLRGRKAAAVRLAGKEWALGCDFLLSGIESECLGSMLAMDGRPVGGEALRSEEMKPTGILVTAHLLVAAEAIPEPMAENVIIVFDYGEPLREKNFLRAEVEDARDRSGREIKRISLNYILDRERLMTFPSYSREVLDALVRKLGEVIQFLEKFIIDYSDPLEEIMRSQFTGDPMIQVSRLMPFVYKSRRSTGPFIGLGHRTGLRNVYRVNSEVCPSLGEDGLWLAGFGAAGIVASMRKGKTKMRRRIMFT